MPDSPAVPSYSSAGAHGSVSLMAAAGQTSADSRTLSWYSGAGEASRRTTMPSSSRWSKTSGAIRTHCPEATHFGTSASTFVLVLFFIWWMSVTSLPLLETGRWKGKLAVRTDVGDLGEDAGGSALMCPDASSRSHGRPRDDRNAAFELNRSHKSTLRHQYN